MTRAPGKRTTDSAITRSLILSAIEAGATYAQAARDAGVSGARARQVAKEAGLPPRTPGGLRSEAVTTRTARGVAILARVVELATAAGEDPADYLEDAARCRVACEAIAERIEWAERHGLYTPGGNPFVDEIRTLAIGPSDTSVELAEQVRAAVGAQ